MAEMKGFLGGPAQPKPSASQEAERNFRDGADALAAGRLGEAYLFFLRAEQTHSATLYNMALCFFMAGEAEKALSFLDKALQALPPIAPETTAVPSELERFESQGEGYRSPMLLSSPGQFPERCRTTILRLKADALFAAGRIQELKALIPALAGKQYKNINAIAEALGNGV